MRGVIAVSKWLICLAFCVAIGLVKGGIRLLERMDQWAVRMIGKLVSLTINVKWVNPFKRINPFNVIPRGGKHGQE